MKDDHKKDILGNEINVGDYIIYAAAQGSSAELKFARVQKFTQIKDYHRPNSALKIVFHGGGESIEKDDGSDEVWTDTGFARIEIYGKLLVVKPSSLPKRVRKELDERYEQAADKRSVSRRGIRKG